MSRVSIIAGLGSAFVLTTAVQAQQVTSPTSREIFTPVDQDLALVHLRKLLGCIVDGVWKSSVVCTDDRPLTAALGYLNGACLIVATIIACYLLYSLVADTANDGEPFGRNTDAKWTLLRVGAGAILALPIKSGLSLVQLLVVQVAIWGSGAGDTIWQRVAQTHLNGMYGSLPPSQPMQGDFVVRGNLARALEGELYGFVCAAALEDYAKNASGGQQHPISPDQRDFVALMTGASTGTATSYYFRDTTRYFRNSSNLCGSVGYITLGTGDTAFDDKERATNTALMKILDDFGKKSIMQAMGTIRNAARSISSSITNSQINDENIRTQISQALDDAVAQASASVLTMDGNYQQTINDYIELSKTNGWLSAVMWQRSMTAIYAKLSSVPRSAEFTITLPNELTSYVPLFSEKGTAYQALVDKAQRDISYVKSLNGFFVSQSTGNPTLITSDIGSKQIKSSEIIARVINAIYKGMMRLFSNPDTTAWKDPVIEAQELGQTISYFAAIPAAAGTATGLASFIDPSGLAKETTMMFVSLTAMLLGCAFLLAGVVPFIIVIHFMLAAINWFLVIAEAMVAVPIWLMTKFMPSRGGFVGNSGQGYVFLLGILLRPPLIIVGFIFSLLLMRLGMDIANMFFRGALGMLAPDSAIVSLLFAAAGIVTYVLALFMIILMAAGFISSVPEQALGWLSNAIERRTAGQAAAGAAASMLPASFGSMSHSGVARGTGQAITAVGRTPGNTAKWLTRRKQLRADAAKPAGS